MSSTKRVDAQRKGPSVTALYQDFERAVAIYSAMPEGTDRRTFDRAVDKASRIADRLGPLPAASIAEMLLKIRVAVWDIGDFNFAHLEDIDDWKPTRLSEGVHYEVLASLRSDLTRMASDVGGL